MVYSEQQLVGFGTRIGKPMVLLLLGCFLLHIDASSSLAGENSKVAEDLQAWSTVLEMFVLDDGRYPTTSSLVELAAEAKRRGYWDAPTVAGPDGRLYVVESGPWSYSIQAASGDTVSNTVQRPEQEAVIVEQPAASEQKANPARAPLGSGTMLTVAKSGSDVVLSWSGTGTVYDGARSTDARFTDPTTLFTSAALTTYAYVGAVTNDRQLEFFDVTDETEDNAATNYYGGVMPPPPPVIDAANPSTNIAGLFVGGGGTIAGNGFSTTPEENTVCFVGGVCTQATTSTGTQIQFAVPPGATSGNVTVTVGDQSSEAEEATVYVEPLASGWLIRTTGFSRQDKSYWMAGTASATNSIYRVFYNAGTEQWIRENRGGGFSGSQHYCGTQTSRTGRLFCGLAQLTTGGGAARVAETSPPGNVASCINLGGSGNSSNIRGAAADPNPSMVAGRDVAYFAHAIESVPAAAPFWILTLAT